MAQDESPFNTTEFKRAKRFGCAIFASLFLIVFLFSLVGPYSELLWFVHDAKQPKVFSTVYSARGTLFTVGFIVALLTLYLNLSQALKASLVYVRSPDSRGQLFISNAMRYVQEQGTTLVKVIAPIVALFYGLGFSNEWQTMLLATNGERFGTVDPMFGKDLGFFVFGLPWYRAISNFAFGLLLLTTLITVGVYVGMQALAMLARIELGRPRVRMHVSALLGSTAIAYAIQLGLKCYEFGLIEGPQFTGAGYAAQYQLWGQAITAIVLALAGLLTIIFAKQGQPYRFAIGGAVVSGAAFLVGVLLIPAITQRFSVEPDKLRAEGPYAARAIKSTRYAYGLDKIEVRETKVTEAPTPQEAAQSGDTLQNMRLWDPEVIREAFEGSQGFRPYYAFNDVDVVRYEIDGERRLVMSSPRDIQISGLTESARSWVNTRLQYTHGYGLAMSPVNEANASGQPTFLAKDIPVRSHPSIKIEQPRIYFSDYRGVHTDRSEYAIVNTRVEEIDYLGETETQNHRWTGQRGIPIGRFLPKLAFSISLGDGNLLVSGNVRSDSRLLIRRGVHERASRVYPFLRLDNDPYLVVVEGRPVWIMDAYTTTDMVPYAERTGVQGRKINYIRNSVKITMDAYTGDMNAYAVLDEPMIRAVRKIFPGLIKDGDTMPASIRPHLRYPEDMFRLQSSKLTQYHVTDPVQFINNGDAWDLPYQKGRVGAREEMEAYYVLIRLPGETRPGFKLILPFTPRQRPNMAGWLAAHCDPEDYGRMILYKFERGSNVPGPELMESRFDQDETIANINKLLRSEQSDIIVGNLLVVPIGNSVLYVEPLFLKSRTAQAIPELRKVILGHNNRIVVADTYQQALERLFGARTPNVAPTDNRGVQTEPGAQPSQIELGPVRDALRLLDEADTALRQGDFARYGELQRQARERLRGLVGQ